MNHLKLEEKRRLEAVHQFLQLDFNKSSEYQDIVDLAAELCKKPMAALILVDENVNWLRVRYGIDIESMPRKTSFCQYVIQEKAMMIIPDVSKDDRFLNIPVLDEENRVVFFAGIPLVLSNGLIPGTLCLLDSKPNSLTSSQEKVLKVLSRQITFLMELEISHKLLELQIEETEAKNRALHKIAQIQSHEIRHPLATIMGLINLIKDDIHKVDDEWLDMVQSAAHSLDSKINAIVNETVAEKDIKVIRFSKMIEEIEDYAIILLDRQGNIENWNSGAQKLKGYEAIEIIGKNFTTFYTEKDLANNHPQKLIEQTIVNGVAKDEGWRVRKDGSQFWVSMILTAIHDDKGEVIGFTKVTRDLTSKRQIEWSYREYIAQLENEIRMLNHQLSCVLVGEHGVIV